MKTSIGHLVQYMSGEVVLTCTLSYWPRGQNKSPWHSYLAGCWQYDRTKIPTPPYDITGAKTVQSSRILGVVAVNQ